MVASIDSFGGSRFPLEVSSAIDSAALYDPGLASIVGLVTAAIEANCGDAWRALVAQLDVTSFIAESTAPVGSVLTVIPSPHNLTQAKRSWPILAIYREGEPTCEHKSFDYPICRQRWSVDWIVGPLGPDTQRKIGHMWVPIRNSIFSAINLGTHPAYLDGAYCFHGQFVEIWPVTAAGPAVTDSLGVEKGYGYFGGSVILESVERTTYQNDAAATGFDGGAYLTPNDGYGDAATSSLVTVGFENKT